MKVAMILGVSLVMAIGLGCSNKQKDGRVRPPVDELADGGRGLQGKDVITASDRMAVSLLALPALNAAQTQWTIVVDQLDVPPSQRQSLDIFLTRLRSKLISMGQGRVQLIENMQKFNELRARELEPTGDRFGQGGIPKAPKTVQPDYFLSGKLAEMPNRDTSYFLIDFTLTKVDRTIVWGDIYEVATKR